ncbi:MAG: leucyl aminopeptidase [Piscirickettsiaceae bacterium]|nr:MAG: leucyl aminopeptidase [Piscirickettsiaceae bacterium]PCI70857.1 MAG: leucyl aminopeptidase [Piscirickettsiaceae bacterium]
MEFVSKSGQIDKLSTPCLILPVFSKGKQLDIVNTFDKANGKQIAAVLKQGDASGKAGNTLLLQMPTGSKTKRVLLVGVGKQGKTKPEDFNKAVSASINALKQLPIKTVFSALLSTEVVDKNDDWKIRQLVLKSREALYQYTETLTSSAPDANVLEKCHVLATESTSAKSIAAATLVATSIANGIDSAKKLANLPGNICTPSYLANTAKELGKQHKSLKVTVLDEAKMEKLGMGSLLSVSRGSREPAKLITMEHNGGPKSQNPVVIVGKGLTFDAGGISIKPSSGMDEMKYDMCGGASVFGVMQMCAELNLPINVVGVVPSSENLPDGDANKPGDIVTSMKGLTIEILNTDAEGRLILCDALTYSAKFKPDVVIDIATLTGACVVALGKHATGLLGNNDELANELLGAGIKAGDKAWQLPLWDEYHPQLKSNFADLANIGGPAAGTITAACFLSRFTEDYKWAHLDIAGTAWKSGADKGATGRPVHMLSQFILDRC